MLLKPLTFHAPKSLPDAAKLFSELPDVKILAGGTFLLNSLKLLKRKGSKTPQHVLSLAKIPELKGVNMQGDQLIIKAMTIINDLGASPLLIDNFAVLKIVCKNISTNQIRNMASVGGNLTCRYTWTEMGAIMIALDANMHFMGADGKEQIISAEDFFKNAAKTDKIFTHVSIKHDKSASIAYRRVKKTMQVDIPLLTVTVKTNFQKGRFTNTRVTVNNSVAFAQRDKTLEDFLNSASCHAGLAEEALTHIDSQIYDTRSDDYKKHMFRVSIKNAIQELMDNHKS